MSAIRNFVGLLIVVILVRLAMMVLDVIIPLELFILLAGIVVIGGSSVLVFEPPRWSEAGSKVERRESRPD